MTYLLARLPQDAVLPGYSLTQQHQIDHHVMTEGSPLALATALPFALVIFGILLMGVLAVFFRTGTPGATIAARPPWWSSLSSSRSSPLA